jgi:hypothetical protein
VESQLKPALRDRDFAELSRPRLQNRGRRRGRARSAAMISEVHREDRLVHRSPVATRKGEAKERVLR